MKIVGFFCNWCAYMAADLAGTMRLEYPSDILIVRVMCSGRVQPEFVVNALKNGADGVLIAGCHPGDCHYIHGNMIALRRYRMIRKVLEELGINPRRVRLEWISASEPDRVKAVIKDFIEDLKTL